MQRRKVRSIDKSDEKPSVQRKMRINNLVGLLAMIIAIVMALDLWGWASKLSEFLLSGR